MTPTTLPPSGAEGPAREIALSFESDVLQMDTTGDGSAVTLTLAGWATAPWSYVVRGGPFSSLGIDSGRWAEAAKLRVRREHARRADGTDVPMVTVDTPGLTARPTPIAAYGAHGISTATPRYNPFQLSWAVHGDVLVYCGTRGGGERGPAWRAAGRLANKAVGQVDFIACAERVVQPSTARPKGIADTGTSVGGLLVPLAIEKRPDLFGALWSRVALLNATRLEAADNCENQYSGMGDLPPRWAGVR